MKLPDALKRVDEFLTEESRLGLKGEAYIDKTMRHAIETILGACLTPEEVVLVRDALDSHCYWQIAERGDVLPVNDGYVLVEQGQTVEDFAAEQGLDVEYVDTDAFEQVQEALALDERLAGLQNDA